jgi:hypothetical protein
MPRPAGRSPASARSGPTGSGHVRSMRVASAGSRRSGFPLSQQPPTLNGCKQKRASMRVTLIVSALLIACSTSGCASQDSRREPHRRPPLSANKLAQASLLSMTQLPSGAQAQDEASSRTLVRCGARAAFWKAGRASASAPVVLIGDTVLGTVVSVFKDRQSATRAFLWLGRTVTLNCYTSTIRRIVRMHLGPRYKLGETGPPEGGAPLVGVRAKSRAYFVTTPAQAGFVQAYVEFAVIQVDRRVWIVAVAQRDTPPTDILSDVARRLIGRVPAQA